MAPTLLPSAISLLYDLFVEHHDRQPSIEEMNNLTKLVLESCAKLCDALSGDEWFQQTPVHEFVGLEFKAGTYTHPVWLPFQWLRESLGTGGPD